jgi:hypothetical protein
VILRDALPAFLRDLPSQGATTLIFANCSGEYDFCKNGRECQEWLEDEKKEKLHRKKPSPSSLLHSD